MLGLQSGCESVLESVPVLVVESVESVPVLDRHRRYVCSTLLRHQTYNVDVHIVKKVEKKNTVAFGEDN